MPLSDAGYPEQQAVNSYQSADRLYCVRAEYRFAANSTDRLDVFNQGRSGSVTGPLQSGGQFLLSAFVVDANRGKLAVGPPFLPRSTYGPYWVVATDARPYSWAIISGGPPNLPGANGTAHLPCIRHPLTYSSSQGHVKPRARGTPTAMGRGSGSSFARRSRRRRCWRLFAASPLARASTCPSCCLSDKADAATSPSRRAARHAPASGPSSLPCSAARQSC